MKKVLFYMLSSVFWDLAANLKKFHGTPVWEGKHWYRAVVFNVESILEAHHFRCEYFWGTSSFIIAFLLFLPWNQNI